MNNNESSLCFLTINEASSLIRTRKISPVELTKAFLNRIEKLDSTLRAYITVLPEHALKEAINAEESIVKGHYKGPLHGIPIALKDIYWTKDVRTTANSRILENWKPSENATVVERLKKEGSVLLGKLNMSEFATLSPDDTSLFMPTRNPWDITRIPGGSSSGAGAAIASGLCMGSLGSDTGGSIRGPATLCGIVGLKPTYGLVSRYGVVPLSWTMDHCGPMTWTVEDAAIMLQVIAGYDSMDSTSSKLPVPNYNSSLGKSVTDITMGVPRKFLASVEKYIHKEVIYAFEEALKVYKDLGANIVDVEIPSMDYAKITGSAIWLSEAYSYHKKNLMLTPNSYGKVARTLFRAGGLFSGGDYIQAQRMRSRIKRELQEIYKKVDLIVTPTYASPAATFKGSNPLDRIMSGINFSIIFNLSGQPAISIPIGFSKHGLPIGMQIAGRSFEEVSVLKLAYAYQQQKAWFKIRPNL